LDVLAKMLIYTFMIQQQGGYPILVNDDENNPTKDENMVWRD
jgi:hypothetical protein